MQAIATKYLPATNTRGSRIKATCKGGSVTIGYPHELPTGEPCHRAAANALCHKMGWTGSLVSGGVGNNYVFCFTNAPELQNALVLALATIERIETRHAIPTASQQGTRDVAEIAMKGRNASDTAAIPAKESK